MKRFYLFLFASFVLLFNSYSQDKGYIGFLIGPSAPTGDFSSTDFDNSNAGFANSGLLLELDFTYGFNEKIGFAATIRSQGYSVDVGTAADQYASAVPDVLWTVESEAYGIGSYLVGIYGNFKIDENISFQPRGMIGVSSGLHPEQKVSFSDDFGWGYVSSDESFASSFSYLIGATFKFDIAKRISLLGKVDYLGVQQEFDIRLVDSFGDTAVDKYSLPMNNLNFGFGIGYRL